MNKLKIDMFNKYLGHRFKEIYEASEGAPITCMTVDEEDKEYYISCNHNENTQSNTISLTGVKIENTQFYQLYSMVSEGLNVFHFESFTDGFAIWYINDSTLESVKVDGDYTLLGISSCLHHAYI